MGGITPDEAQPGYKHINIRPQIVEKIDWVKVSKDTPYGKLSVNWEKKGAKVDINVEIPVGSTATLYTPDNKTITLPSGHHNISCDIVK